MAAENDDRPARHVLARVVADSLDDRGRARVPHREALPGRAGAEEVAPRRAVEDRVPEQDGSPASPRGGETTMRPPDIDLPT